MVNVTILAIESERPDTRIDACLGQPLAFFLTAENSTALGDSFRPDDVHAAVSASDFCPVGDGNVVNITVRLVGPRTRMCCHACSGGRSAGRLHRCHSGCASDWSQMLIACPHPPACAGAPGRRHHV